MLTEKVVTTSWDDGSRLDLRLAELLQSRRLAGTFYVPFRGYRGRPTLETSELALLASGGFELGGHSMSHDTLTQMSSSEIALEVGTCKDWLENILGQRVRMFSYPRGRFDARVLSRVKEAGYAGARTTRMVQRRLDFDPFKMPTSLLVFPNTKMDYARNLVGSGNVAGLFDYFTQYIRLDSWVSMGKLLFDLVLRHGGVWHLYGHSWEIEEMGLWDDLKEILDYVSGREGVHYVTNAEVLDFLPQKAIGALEDSVLPH